ncbi:hypothetical protein DFH11DRAFT_1548050 [Phellopilus nigrolimitatus]|nr:hypothetical protein DFH11DRAFT_1548050 [Phellopilus nigrolimitatus]
MSRNETFKEGLECFRQGKYKEALIKFDEAILEYSKEQFVHVPRADLFKELGRPAPGPTSSGLMGGCPISPIRYTRPARLFPQITNLEASLKMAELALERLNDSYEKRRVELDALKQQALKNLEPPPCFFKIPANICGNIFVLVTEESGADTLALTHVCRGWREIILNKPSLWRRLVLTQRTRDEKVDAWLQRSKGTLTSLEIRKGFDFDGRPYILRYAAKCFWAKLESLKMHLPREIRLLSLVLPSGAPAQLQLQALEVDFSDERVRWFNVNGNPFRDLDLTRLSSLILRNAGRIGASWKSLLPCTALTTLDIQKCTIAAWDILSVLVQNPLLETLTLVSGYTLAGNPIGITEPVELFHLRYLRLVVPGSTDEMQGPGPKTGATLDVLLEQSLPHLMELKFTSCSLERPVVLISLLQSSLKLERFSFQGCLEVEAVNIILKALAEPVPGPSSQERSETSMRPICCPRLQHLDFKKSIHLKAKPIMRLVEAHLPPADVPSEGNSGADPSSTFAAIQPPPLLLPIQTLILDKCEAFDPKALPWLQEKVPQVSFQRTKRKKAKGRMW